MPKRQLLLRVAPIVFGPNAQVWRWARARICCILILRAAIVSELVAPSRPLVPGLRSQWRASDGTVASEAPRTALSGRRAVGTRENEWKGYTKFLSEPPYVCPALCLPMGRMLLLLLLTTMLLLVWCLTCRDWAVYCDERLLVC